ncbi:MAG: AI-2E family transporter [Longimicrobiales bacterium]|nr:AI-2E family transporter [Longimicrobiales bacterium]
MIYDRSERHPGARFLLVLASGVVVVWGLQFAAPILVPTALALFLAVLTYPVVSFLKCRRVPATLAILTAVGMVVGLASLLLLGASRALADLRQVGDRYVMRLQEIQVAWARNLQEALGDVGIQLFGEGTQEIVPLTLLGRDQVLEFLGGTAQLGASLLAQAVLVVLVMGFILSEMTALPGKLEAILGSGIRGEERIQKIMEEVQEYLGIKTVVSLMTGLAIGGWAWFMGLDFPVLLGVIGFFLNYIPTVGSIIASIPGIALSLILVGTVGHALVVALGYFAINTIFGSILEPSLMGRRLGISTLVVMLSLLFWGWTWGPLGALLSVPLTMVVKIFLENTRDLRWVAILIDKRPPVSVASLGSSPSGGAAASGRSGETPAPGAGDGAVGERSGAGEPPLPSARGV